MKPSSARLFIAIDLPADRAGTLASLQDDSLSARWTPAGQMHVTLRFLGDANDRTTQSLREALGTIRGEAHALAGTGLDVFPSRRRPRVLVMKMSTPPILLNLRNAIEQVVQSEGADPELRPFQPHVTLARLKGERSQAIRAYLKALDAVRIDPFVVTAFHLYRSDLHAEGATHTVLQSYPLEG